MGWGSTATGTTGSGLAGGATAAAGVAGATAAGTFGTEIAVGIFLVAYLFLAGTLCGRLPLPAVIGLVLAIGGTALSYQSLLLMQF